MIIIWSKFLLNFKNHMLRYEGYEKQSPTQQFENNFFRFVSSKSLCHSWGVLISGYQSKAYVHKLGIKLKGVFSKPSRKLIVPPNLLYYELCCRFTLNFCRIGKGYKSRNYKGLGSHIRDEKLSWWCQQNIEFLYKTHKCLENINLGTI